MTRLTKIEKETIILFNEGESTASIYTYNAGLKKRLAAFSKKYPDLCQMEKPEHSRHWHVCRHNPYIGIMILPYRHSPSVRSVAGNG